MGEVLVNNSRSSKTKAKIDITAKRAWSFSAFYDKPLVETSKGRYMNIRPWFLANKATPFGYFSLIESLLPANSKETLKWSRLFGRAVETLGQSLLNENVPYLNRMDEQAITNKWGSGKVCDALLLGSNMLAIDFVFRRINKNTATTGNMEDYAKDLKAGVTEKLQQIDETYGRIFAAGDEPSSAAYSLVVIGAPFPVNGIILGKVDEFVAQNLKVIGQNNKCRPPMIMDLQEYWLFLQTARQQSMHPATLLEIWIQSDMKVASFHNFYTTRGPNTPPPEEKRQYNKYAIKHVFGKDYS